MRYLIGVLTVLTLWGSTGCSRESRTTSSALDQPWFADITSETGITFVHQPVSDPPYLMPSILGSGVACFDADQDGMLDLYFVQAGNNPQSTNRLYRQSAPFRFEDVTANSGLGIHGHGMGVAIGDINNDGRLDVLVTQYGGQGVRLFQNDGGGTFHEITQQSGLINPLWATSAVFADFDRDGWLDLFVTNYVDYDPAWQCTSPDGTPDFCAPKTFLGTADKLFRNRADGTFEDVSIRSGIAKQIGNGLGVIAQDLTGDGWCDFLVANDGQANRLWVNLQNGTFRDEAISRGLAFNAMGQAEANMGIAPGDFDRDGLIDIYITHLNTEIHRLWRQSPRGAFQDRTLQFGLQKMNNRQTGFGTIGTDFDLDGWTDLVVTNGSVLRNQHAPLVDELGEFWSRYAETHQLFRNQQGRFTDMSELQPAFRSRRLVGRGLITPDLDADGAPDLVITGIHSAPGIYRNVAPDRGNWLHLTVRDPRYPRDAVGAIVTVHAGADSFVRVLSPSDSYLCCQLGPLLFGLGKIDRYDLIHVRWPDGAESTFAGGVVNQSRQIERGAK